MEIVYHNRNRLDETIEKFSRRDGSHLRSYWQLRLYLIECALHPETYHMIGERELCMMKSTAVFINTARGNMVDEQALAAALRDKRIWAAGLDVFEEEPHILPELLTLDNVVLAPHAATKTMEDRIRMSEEMVQNIIGFYEGRYPISRVN